MKEKLSDITAKLGPVVAHPMPPPMEDRWLVFAWDSKNRYWHLEGTCVWIRPDAAEKCALELPKKYTHYRIVKIPGDANDK